jgi:hypothetical protein
MKNSTFILGISIMMFLHLSSCGNDASIHSNSVKDNKFNQENAADTNSTVSVQKEEVVPAEISCSIYFKSMDFTDEETGEVTKGTVAERKDFKTKKAYIFCYDSEDFDHLTLKGKGQNITLKVKKGNKILFSKENFSVEDKLNFTSKQFSFIMAEEYTIEISQNETQLFKGQISSQGCM